MEEPIKEVFDWWDEPAEEDIPEYPKRGAYIMKELPPNDGMGFMKDASCAGWAYGNPGEENLWFSEAGTNEDAKAVDICFECPVRAACLKWATDVKESGTWGGQPQRIRTRHKNDFEILLALPNPYDTDNQRLTYHRENLRPHVEKEDT